MSTTTQSVPHTNGATGELNQWRDHTRVVLQPIAAPSILGLFGFAVATFMVTAYLVGWYGTSTSPSLIFPFATAAGGIAQGVAALWAYRARDGLATAVHGIWAAFWLGYGFLNLLIALHVLPASAPHAAVPELAFWFYPLAAVTLVAAFASLAESVAISAVLFPLAVGAALIGVFYSVGGSGWEKVGGYVTMASAFTAFYAASAMMLASTVGRVILPLGKYGKPANETGDRPAYPIQFEFGEPGVKQGQ
ncbi:MAG: acetate uptake transporter family protein [Solirubrobacteraceae bacterium]